MAENNNQQNPAQQQDQPQFSIQRIYLKDASLEMPNSPAIFLLQESPEISIQVEVEQATVQTDIYEVVVRATVTAKAKMDGQEKTVFLLECKEAGIFLIQNFPAEHVPMILGITCPTTIYPYLRSNISDLLNRAGLPPIYLGEVNFEALYAQKIQRTAAAQAANAPATPQ